jgi:hypothetical protein
MRSQRHLREVQGIDSTTVDIGGGSVSIDTPSAGGTALTFAVAATATNSDGGAAQRNVSWSSNVDGFLRYGDGSVTVTSGAHTLTADLGGVTDTVAITAS